jgi:hypothetical protein
MAQTSNIPKVVALDAGVLSPVESEEVNRASTFRLLGTCMFSRIEQELNFAG